MSEQTACPVAVPPERSLAPREADERETLTSFLDFQRATLAAPPLRTPGRHANPREPDAEAAAS